MSKRQCKQCGSKSQEEAKAKCFRAAYDYCIFHALPKVSEPSAGAVKVSAQHGASDNSEQDQPKGCHECAWGKVAGCWRCGSR